MVFSRALTDSHVNKESVGNIFYEMVSAPAIEKFIAKKECGKHAEAKCLFWRILFRWVGFKYISYQ